MEYGPDYALYSQDLFNGRIYLGGWASQADIGPDQIYVCPDTRQDLPMPITWNGYVPYLAYHINDPSIVRLGGTDYMFVTALSNAYCGSFQDETTHNVTGLAGSIDGQTWTWAGIVVGQDNGYDNLGAWSPSAMVVDSDISLWYNTSDSEVLHSTLNSSTHLQSTQACFVNGQPLHLANVSVAAAPDGLYMDDGANI